MQPLSESALISPRSLTTTTSRDWFKFILSTDILSSLSCEFLITDGHDIARKIITQAHSISEKLLMKCQGTLGTESSEAHVNPIHRHRGSQTYGHTVCPNSLLPAVRAPSVRNIFNSLERGSRSNLPYLELVLARLGRVEECL